MKFAPDAIPDISIWEQPQDTKFVKDTWTVTDNQ